MKKIISGFNMAVLLGCLLSPGVFASNDFALTLRNYALTPNFSVKGESQDSATRTGTENWEQPQKEFFVVPGIILGLAALILFWKRD